jgi:hypothetical protein
MIVSLVVTEGSSLEALRKPLRSSYVTVMATSITFSFSPIKPILPMPNDTEIPDDFVSLETLMDNPDELNVQLRLDLLRMIDGIRLSLATGGTIGIQAQQQLVQGIKLIKSLTADINKEDVAAGSSIAALMNSLPFTQDEKKSITNDLPFEDQ